MIKRNRYRFALVALTLSHLVGQSPSFGAPRSDLTEAITTYRARQDTTTPAATLAWLAAGNERFVAGRATQGGYFTDARERVAVSATGQHPLAAVLSCIDSRTTPEIVFDTSVGDLFTARVGANVINDDVLGSLEIAAESGAKVIVVLGHTDCGGIKAACNGLELEHFTQLLQRIKPAIASTNAHLDHDPAFSAIVGERTAANPHYVKEVSHANAKQSLAQIRERSASLREKIAKGELLILSALFDVNTGAVHFDPLE